MTKGFLTDTRGGSTVEAAVMFPLVLFLMVFFVFFALLVYHRLVLLDTAVYAARQRAQTWSNSRQDLEDGSRAGLDDDGLYWRLINDQPGTGLTTRKIAGAWGLIDARLQNGVFRIRDSAVNVDYEKAVGGRAVAVRIDQDVIIPVDWVAGLLGTRLHAGARAGVIEPMEVIRNFDLAADYLERLAGYLQKIAQEEEKPDKPAERRGPVVASGRDEGPRNPYYRVYHYPDCLHVRQIKPGNRLEFSSPEAARQAGYRLCRLCMREQRDLLAGETSGAAGSETKTTGNETKMNGKGYGGWERRVGQGIDEVCV